MGEIATWLPTLGLTSLAAAAAAWGVFKWLGRQWIEDHFSRELEAFKAEKQVELEKLRAEYRHETERLKADLNRFADRASRYHGREYEVLPEAWGLMNKAYSAAQGAISAFQQHADLNQMEQAQFTEWLGQSGLEQYQKDELNLAADKNHQYMTMRNWKQIGEAGHAAGEFVNYLILQGIFIDEPLSAKMMEAGMNMRKAIMSRSMVERLAGQSHFAGQTNFWQQAVDEIGTVGPVVSDVKQAVRQHLSNIRLAPSDVVDAADAAPGPINQFSAHDSH